MADTKKILEGLQILVTDLAQQADGHAIQSKFSQHRAFPSSAQNTRNTQRKKEAMLTSALTVSSISAVR